MTTLAELHEEMMQRPEYVAAAKELEVNFEVGRALLRIRIEHGLTIKEMAKKLGLSRRTLLRLEQGA